MKASIIAVLSVKLSESQQGGQGYKIQARDVMTNRRFQYVGGWAAHTVVADWLEQQIKSDRDYRDVFVRNLFERLTDSNQSAIYGLLCGGDTPMSVITNIKDGKFSIDGRCGAGSVRDMLALCGLKMVEVMTASGKLTEVVIELLDEH